ncbi:DUF7450 family protein [Stieleria varia]|uniref:DUF7450 domain-containing protein n=1 Tax=Stieleria varia TaxID=2528005 RepID=A0A5C6B850_9BACT|nr:hypothetical protein [Stieleria varia]TWU08138.1 hypothetical protein Pla52n_07200 [Stieleria varia]
MFYSSVRLHPLQTIIRILPLAALIGAGVAFAHSPVEFMEVLQVKPGRLVEHSVDVKTSLDASRTESNLTGPTHFSRSVGCMNKIARSPYAYLNWYSIEKNNPPRVPSIREVTILDRVRGSENQTLKLGPAAYQLIPSQWLTTGTPDEIPAGLDHYTAYEVVEGPQVDLVVSLITPEEKSSRKVGKPIFICVPSNQWHHDESVKPSHESDGFVVYELDSSDFAKEFTVIDQFGLNQITAASSKWIACHAAIMK